MKKILITIFLYSTTIFLNLAIADEIVPIDAESYSVVDSTSKTYAEQEIEIQKSKEHKEKLEKEQERIVSLILEEEEKIAKIQSEVTEAKQKAIDANIIPGVKTVGIDLEEISPSKDSVNWTTN